MAAKKSPQSMQGLVDALRRKRGSFNKAAAPIESPSKRNRES